MELGTGPSQGEDWGEVVATVLSHVVQHCPECSRDARVICSLLQVNTACRTSLQRMKGRCVISITSNDADRLNGCLSWLRNHPNLEEELHISEFRATCATTACEALSAAVPELSSLRALTLTSQDQLNGCSEEGVAVTGVLPDSVVSSLAGLPQLTYLNLGKVHVGCIGFLPPTVQDLVIVVDPCSLEGTGCSQLEGPVGPGSLPCLDFGHLTALSRLSVTSSLPVEPEDSQGFDLFDNAPSAVSGVAGVSVKVPTWLKSLRVAGPIMDVCFASDSESAGLQQFDASGNSMSVGKLAAFLAQVPNLSHLQLERYMRLPFGWCVEPMRLEDAALLAASVGSASQLTSLRILGCAVGSAFAALTLAADSSRSVCVQRGKHLEQLRELRGLYLEELALHTEDVLALTSLTQLTALRLKSCSPGVQADTIHALCSQLTELQELHLGKSANLSVTGPDGQIISLSGNSTEMFPAVAQLTMLRVLSLGDIYGMSCSEVDLQLLKPLACLTTLILPPQAEGFAEAAFEGFVAEMPSLQCIKAGEKVMTVRAGGPPVILLA